MRKDELEGEGFPVDSLSEDHSSRSRRWYHSVRASLSRLRGNVALKIDRLWFHFEPWKCLTFFGIVWLFIALVVPYPFVNLLTSGHKVEACGWLALWFVVLVLLDHSADVRRGKAKAGVKARWHPNAVNEYVELLPIEVLNRD